MALKFVAAFCVLLLFGKFAHTSAAAKCHHGGRKYNPGQVLRKDCNKCYCLQHGAWVCSEKKCSLSTFQGIQLSPGHDVTMKQRSQLFIICKSERKTSRFSWFIDDRRIKSLRKVTISKSTGESVLLLSSDEFQRRFVYVTCFVPPFTPKRIKVRLANASEIGPRFPNIDSSSKIIEAISGKKVRLDCHSKEASFKTVTWFKFRAPVGLSSGRVTVSSNGSLFISKAKKPDSGLYECMVVNDVGASLSTFATSLIVNKDLKSTDPVNGGWCEWEHSGNCSVGCGDGLKVAIRKCACPSPANGGRYCLGSAHTAVKCNLGDCPRDIRILGEISVGGMKNKDVSKGTCLHIGIIADDIKCVSKGNCRNCVSVSAVTKRGFKITEQDDKNIIKYSMNVKSIKTGNYLIGSLIQLGHCEDFEEATEALKATGCFPSHMMFNQKFTVDGSSVNIKKNLIANFEEKLQSIKGTITLRPNVKEISPQSCFRVSVWHDVLCHGPFDCRPILEMSYKSLKLQDSKIPYELKLDEPLHPGSYILKASLLFGRCPHATKVETELGDFVSLDNKYLFINEDTSDYMVDWILDKKKATFGKRDIRIIGTIRLEDYQEDKMQVGSCLTVKAQEDYKCNETEGCRKPFVGEKTIQGLKLSEGSKISYDIIFREVTGNEILVSAILNVGWCKNRVKGIRKIRIGDFRTTEATLVVSNESKRKLNASLTMEEFQGFKAKKVFRIEGELMLEGIESDMLKDSCVKLVLGDSYCRQGKPCFQKPMATKFLENLRFSPKGTIPFKVVYKGASRKQSFRLYAIFHNGWCNLDGSKSIRANDLYGDVAVDSADAAPLMVLKKSNNVRFIDGPLARAELDKDSLIVKGSIVLPLNDVGSEIGASSCLIVTVREATTCDKGKFCPESIITRTIFRDLGPTTKNTIAYELTVSPKLRPNANYLFEALLNRGWCSEGDTDNKWIKDGDLFNTVDGRFENTDVEAVLQNVVLKVFKNGDEDKEKCNLRCPKILDPVCGSDNRTYNSLCDMETEACIKDTGLTLLHKGECERCKRDCPRIIEPICARNGKTYENVCIMDREACYDNIYLTFRHRGECGSVTMRGDIRFPKRDPLPDIPKRSCLIIKTRKAVYCDFPETCPDFELAEVVQRNVTIPSTRRIPYEIVMNPRPKSSVYLVEVVLNRGWCSADSYSSQWIKNDDFFNDRETPFAVRGSEPIYRDVKIRKLTNLKELEDKAPSGLIDPCKIYKCPFYAKCSVEFGEGRCTCPLMCPAISKPVCGSNDKTYDSLCAMKSESCFMKKLITVKYNGKCKKTSLTISGDVLLEKIRPIMPNGSCLIINIREDTKCPVNKEKCYAKTIARIVQKYVFIPPSNRIYFKEEINPRPNPGTFVVTAVLNRGWCQRRQDSTLIRNGDFYSNVDKKFEILKSGDIQLEIVLRQHSPHVDKDSVLVKGSVEIPKDQQDIQNGSCLSISLHENVSCKTMGSCSDQPIIRFYVKNLDKFPAEKIPYQAMIKPRPKPGSYILSVVLNRGWCSEGSDEWIRDGDLFLDEGQKLEIGAAGSVYKDVLIKKYNQGLPCTAKEGISFAHGEDVNGNGNGCHGCQCKNGTIVCKSTVCPIQKCDNGHLSIEDGDCCPRCVQNAKCKREISDKTYTIGEMYFNRNSDLCETCTCNVTGKFFCTKKACPLLNCKRPLLIGSSCCPVCPSQIKCKDRKSGMLYKAGETWIGSKANGCSKCKCISKPESKSMGYIECAKPSCPRLNCAQKVFPKGYCCPVCLKKRPNGPFKEADVSYLQALIFNEVVSSEISCSDEAAGGIFVEGERWRHGCTNYLCTRSGIISKPVACPYLACPKACQVKKLGECCSSCSPECMPKLFCTSEAIVLVVPRSFLPHTKAIELVFGNGDCTSKGNATHLVLEAALNKCGTKQSNGDGSNFKYANMAYTREDENAMISRVRLVKIPVVCNLPARSTNLLSREFRKINQPAPVINPIPEDTGPVEAFDVFMKVTDENGVEKSPGKPIKFESPEAIYIELGGTGLVENNVTVRADYCYLTPTPSSKNKVNYTLIKDGCAIDSTVAFHEARDNGQRFSFKSLVFANPKAPGFYLHCDSVTCNVDDITCRRPCRQKRALRSQERKFKLINRVNKDGRKTVMKLTLRVVVG